MSARNASGNPSQVITLKLFILVESAETFIVGCRLMTDNTKGIQHKPNRLIHEKSPYLLQHAHNPVDWYAWGKEPFARAKEEDKPLFLSIGYSTCHWCHVMEYESFENQEIADILNTHFISIKVDREERPDIDSIYMTATQAMTGAGGWPMSVFLFADKKPFFAGTYFPPEQRPNHPGFGQLLQSIHRAWLENRQALTDSAQKITDFLVSMTSTTMVPDIKPAWSDACYQALCDSYDSHYHGFGNVNKFPRPSCLDFLLTHGYRTHNAIAHKMAENTLMAMAMGGMYDHVGGGFHRYSVDRQWRIPHFEKMLYDQAQLVVSYVQLYQLTDDPYYSDIVEETIDYVLRSLQHPDGGFYSAEDADSVNPYDESEHGEGAYYLWKASEIREILGSDADQFITCYGIKENGNALEDPAQEFTGRNIPYLIEPLSQLAKAFAITPQELRESLRDLRQKLLARREKRTSPHLDDKIIAAWNGLMLSALSRAGSILERQDYLEEAERVARFIFTNLMVDNRLKRRWRDGEARFDAVLEDYAFVIQGLLDLYSATHENQYLQAAIELSEKQVELFSDQNGGFFSSGESTDLLTRMKESYDGAEPSGNSVAAANYLRLGRMLDKPEWIAITENTIKSFGKVLEAQGLAMPLMLNTAEIWHMTPQHLIIAGRKDDLETVRLMHAAKSKFRPQLHILLADGGKNHKMLAEHLGFLQAVTQVDDKATAYLCRDYTCHSPIKK